MNKLEQDHADMVKNLSKDGQDIIDSLTPQKAHAWHMSSALNGEAGETFDAVKKWVIYEKKIDFENIVEELGDMEFYLEGLRSRLGITREMTLATNIEKLIGSKTARYKSGEYSNEQAQDRADK